MQDYVLHVSRFQTRAGRRSPVVGFLPGIAAAAVLLTAGLLTGCGGPSGAPTVTAAKPGHRSGALTRVRFRMSWLPSAEYAGILAAAHNGYYAQQGLDCQLEPGGVGLNSLQLVATGADDIGLAGSDSLLVARSRGIPVKAFAAEFQQSPQVFFARKSSGITTPLQWPGHTVGIKVGKTAETMFNAIVGKLHLDAARITTVPVKAGIQEFLAGKVDVWPGFVFDEPVQAEAAGVPVNIIEPSKYGVVLYSDVIFAADKTVQSNPAMIRGFLKATQQGWEWCRDHPTEALTVVTSMYPTLDVAHEKVRLAGTLPRVAGTAAHPVKPVGRMDPAIWTGTYQMLQRQHLLQSNFPVEQAYTLQFLK